MPRARHHYLGYDPPRRPRPDAGPICLAAMAVLASLVAVLGTAALATLYSRGTGAMESAAAGLGREPYAAAGGLADVVPPGAGAGGAVPGCMEGEDGELSVGGGGPGSVGGGGAGATVADDAAARLDRGLADPGGVGGSGAAEQMSPTTDGTDGH